MVESEQIILYYVEENEEIERNVEKEEDPKVFKCQFCPSTFDRELGLYGHLNSHKVKLYFWMKIK